jgi:predicted nucleic-acid-binding protein
VIALDTSVVVRVVTGDDPRQLASALEVMQADRLWAGKTVLLETEWVLRYSYGLDRGTIAATFEKLLGYPRLQVEDRAAVLRACAHYAAGMDFADALHLASSPEAERFATFDRPMAKAATRLQARPEVLLLGQA